MYYITYGMIVYSPIIVIVVIIMAKRNDVETRRMQELCFPIT